MLFPLTLFTRERKLYKYFDNKIASAGLPLANIFGKYFPINISKYTYIDLEV